MSAGAAQESLQLRLRKLYQSFGYLPFKVNKFEEYDLYAQNKSFLSCQRVLTFSDTDGRLMALKPDVTLSIVRSTNGREPLRKVYYTENVYRVPGDGEGFREIPQTGLECIGDVDLYAVSEVLMLAARSLELIGENVVLGVSHMGLLSGLLSAAGLEGEEAARLLNAVSARNTPELAGMDLADGIMGPLLALTSLYGPFDEALEALCGLALPPQCNEALLELSSLSSILSRWGVRNVNLDPSVVNDAAYYSGLVFRGFVDGAASSVLSGGRYDPLLEKMGKSGGAIGFAVYLDRLERLLTSTGDYDADALILYGGEGDIPEAVKRAAELTACGLSVRVQRAAPAGLSFRKRLLIRDGEMFFDE